jgi:hypothetical protein
MSKRPITFPKTSDGVWTNAETGVRIVRRHPVAGGGYRPERPADVTRGYIGIAVAQRTLDNARALARRYVRDAARYEIAKAYVEARREQDHAEALRIDRGYPSGQSRIWAVMVYDRAVKNTQGYLPDGAIVQARHELLTEAHEEALECAMDRQGDAWQARHADTPRVSAYWMIDAREADHAEALVENTERAGREVSQHGIMNAARARAVEGFRHSVRAIRENRAAGHDDPETYRNHRAAMRDNAAAVRTWDRIARTS